MTRSSRSSPGRVFRRSAAACMAFIILGLGLYLLLGHNVKAYSDPFGYLMLSGRLADGQVFRYAPLYPAFLAAVMPLSGPAWVFLVNLPLLLLMVSLLYLVTKELCPLPPQGKDAAFAEPAVAGITAVVLFISTHRVPLLEIVNPYREALAFTLLLGGVLLALSFFHRRGLWRAGMSALLLGLAAGVRENLVLILLPVLLLFIVTFLRRRDPYWLLGAGCFALFFLAGIAPILYFNHLYSGRPFLPAFASHRWDRLTGAGGALPADIPVPGMSLRYFSRTGGRVLAYLLQTYHWWGIVLAAAGAAISLARRNTAVLFFLLPAAAVNILFFSLWHSKQWRFYITFDLFLAPLVGIGAAALFALFTGAVDRGRKGPSSLPAAALIWLLAALTIYGLAARTPRYEAGLKAWQTGKISPAILPSLEQPFAFAGRSHYSQMLSWFLGSGVSTAETELDGRAVLDAGMDGALRERGRKSLEGLSRRALYVYEEDRGPFLEQWFSFEPRLSLGEAVAVPLQRYGRRLEGVILQVSPWRDMKVVRSLPVKGGGGPALLRVDAFRLWDYPSRTSCRLYAGNVLLEERVPDGLHFIPLPPEALRGSEVEIRLESDAPLPPDPVLEVHPVDGKMEIFFGLAAPGGWYYPHLSGEINGADPLKSDGFTLSGGGRISLPKFCGAGDRLAAVFRVENFPGKAVTAMDYEVTLQSAVETVRLPLGGKGEAARIFVDLGEGDGSFAMVPVELSYRRPGDDRRAFVKFHRVALSCSAPAGRTSLSLDIGGDDLPFVRAGFHPPAALEDGGAARWTDGRGVLRLPPVRGDGPLFFTVDTVEVRPADRRSTPRFLVSGTPLPPSSVTVEDAPGDRRRYTFTVEGDREKGDLADSLVIESATWRPSGNTGRGDTRKLGILVDTLSLRPSNPGGSRDGDAATGR